MKVCPLLPAVRRAASGLAGRHPLRLGGGNDVRLLAYAFDCSMYLQKRERERKEIPRTRSCGCQFLPCSPDARAARAFYLQFLPIIGQILSNPNSLHPCVRPTPPLHPQSTSISNLNGVSLRYFSFVYRARDLSRSSQPTFQRWCRVGG